MNTQRKLAGAVGLAVLLLSGLALLFQWGAPQLAAATCDTVAMSHLRAAALKSSNAEDVVTARYLTQEIAACEGRPIEDLLGKSTSSAPSTTSTVRPEVKRHWEFLANRPAPEKVAVNAFGPKIALAESNASKPMGELNASEAYEEHRFRLKLDPMQTAATECGTALTPCKIGEVDEKTRLYASDLAAWDRANDQLLPRLDKMKKEVRRITVGTPVPMQYALPGEIPLVVMDDHVVFPYDIMVIVYTDADGRGEYSARLECGFQWLGAKVRPMPKPSPGLIRTPEGTPEKEKPPSSTTTPLVTTTTVVTTTPPVTTTTTTSECPNGQKPPCSKTSAPQPPGVGSPTSNPVGTPTSKPTQTDPLEPTGAPRTQTTRTTAPPVVGTTSNPATATISAPPPQG